MTAFNSLPFMAFLRRSPLWIKLKTQILHPDRTPEQIAMSFGLGLAISFNPLLGLHTMLAVGLCLAFRKLHRPLLFASVMINNPWTMVPIATLSAYTGNLLMGRGLELDLSRIRWDCIGWRSFATRQGVEGSLSHAEPDPCALSSGRISFEPPGVSCRVFRDAEAFEAPAQDPSASASHAAPPHSGPAPPRLQGESPWTCASS